MLFRSFRRFSIFVKIDGHKSHGVTGATVSYTHLDVYKRQDILRSVVCNVLVKCMICARNGAIPAPVSYTHLVVGYEIEATRITVWFKGGKPYSYSYNLSLIHI